jgi:SpoVK/Ycf46/Vps4 family AAA+-type ATPase
MLINEADGFMNRRTEVHQSNDAFHNQLQTAMLELLESFEGIVFATTNLFGNLDEAFHRRFLFKQEIEMPDRQTRIQIMEHSDCFRQLTDELKRKIAEISWSPAEFANFEKRFRLLEAADLTHRGDLDTFFFECNQTDYEKKPIGFGVTHQIK